MLYQRLFCLVVAAIISACAHVPGPEATDALMGAAATWQVTGRFAAGQASGADNPDRVEREPVAGRFAWQHSTVQDVLWLIGPLGNTLARVDMTSTGVRWQDAAGKRGEVTDLRALGESLAGIVLPEVPADRWLHAQWPADDVRQRDATTRVLLAAARGWQFNYRYGEPAPADWPLAIEAIGPDGLWLRLALTAWNGISDPAEQPRP